MATHALQSPFAPPRPDLDRFVDFADKDTLVLNLMLSVKYKLIAEGHILPILSEDIEAAITQPSREVSS